MLYVKFVSRKRRDGWSGRAVISGGGYSGRAGLPGPVLTAAWDGNGSFREW